LEHDDLQDTLDHLAIISGGTVFDAHGNIGNGVTDSLNTTLNLPFDTWGIVGGRLKMQYILTNSRVLDPITHMPRSITGIIPNVHSLTYSQNLSRLNMLWSVGLQSGHNTQVFNATEYYKFKTSDQLELTLQIKRPKGLMYTLQWQNPIAEKYGYERLAWAGLRGRSALISDQIYQSSLHQWITFQVRRDF
jgi:hypothetical protein